MRPYLIATRIVLVALGKHFYGFWASDWPWGKKLRWLPYFIACDFRRWPVCVRYYKYLAEHGLEC